MYKPLIIKVFFSYSIAELVKKNIKSEVSKVIYKYNIRARLDKFKNHTNFIMENEKILKEDWYKAKNLSGRDSQLLVELSTANIDAISKTIGALEALQKNLNIYKDCLVDSINLEVESADLASKYAQDMSYQNNYNLPGTISMPKSYDIDAVKADSARMIEIQKDRNKISSQADTYLNICKSQMKVFIENWKNLNYGSVSWKEFLMSLNNNINQNY